MVNLGFTWLLLDEWSSWSCFVWIVRYMFRYIFVLQWNQLLWIRYCGVNTLPYSILLFDEFILDFISCIRHLRMLGTINVCALMKFSRFISVYNYLMDIWYKYALNGFKRIVKCRTMLTLNLLRNLNLKVQLFFDSHVSVSLC